MGPLNNEDVASKMDRHVQDALDRGATLVHGGRRLDDTPTRLYYEPTVLIGVTREMAVNHEETFGPIAPIIEFDTYDEALEIANEISLGLSSGVFTNSIENMYYFAERVETGLVNINEGAANWEIHTPIGGYSGKDSGVGRIGGRFTLEELSQLKTVIVDIGEAG
jgi:succinate-semialdehyde dehydrogenase/glutarate-semialdehyde dehydrogenase